MSVLLWSAAACKPEDDSQKQTQDAGINCPAVEGTCCDGSCSGEAGTGAEGSLSLEDFCSGASDNLCEHYVRCGYAASFAGCKQYSGDRDPFANRLCPSIYVQAVREGRMNFHPDRAAACVDWLIAAGGQCLREDFSKTPCDKIFTGGRKLGESCAENFDCCAGELAYCQPPREEGGTSVCAPRLCEGERAPNSGACRPGLYSYEGVCTVLATNDCRPLREGGPYQQCEQGSFCRHRDTSCVSGPFPSCSICPSPLVCSSSCSSPIAAGQPCPIDAMDFCQVDATCVATPGAPFGGICQPRPLSDEG